MMTAMKRCSETALWLGLLCLVRASKTGYDRISALDLFKGEPGTDKDTWSHPALVGNRLYLRNLLGVNCVLLE